MRGSPTIASSAAKSMSPKNSSPANSNGPSNQKPDTWHGRAARATKSALTAHGMNSQAHLCRHGPSVKSRKVGRVRTCALDIAAMTRLEAWIAERKGFWEQQYDQLDAYLAQATAAEKP